VLEGIDRVLNRGEHVVGTELRQEYTVLEVVVNQLRRPRDPDAHSLLPEFTPGARCHPGGDSCLRKWSAPECVIQDSGEV
jgi:hypothetical protein